MGRSLYIDNDNVLFSDYNIIKKYKSISNPYSKYDIWWILIEIGNLICLLTSYFLISIIYIQNKEINFLEFLKKLSIFILFKKCFYEILKKNGLKKIILNLLEIILLKSCELILSIFCSWLMFYIELDSCVTISILIILYYISNGKFMIKDIVKYFK